MELCCYCAFSTVFFLHRGHKSEYNEAIIYYKMALGIGLKFLGANHPDIAIFNNNLGLAYNNKSEYDQAITHYQEALTIFLKFPPSTHPTAVLFQ